MISINVEGLTPSQIQRKYHSTIQHGLEVMRLAAQGFSYTEISTQIFLSESAVKSRLKALYAVIGARNQAHAIAICAANGWYTEEDFEQVLKARQFRSINLPKEPDETQSEN